MKSVAFPAKKKPGQAETKIEMARVCSKVLCDSPSLQREIERTYNTFISSEDKKPDILVWLSKGGGYKIPKRIKFNISKDGYIYACGRGLMGLVDLPRAVGICSFSSVDIASYDSFIRLVYSLFVPKFNGLLLHSAAVIAAGKGYVFIGPSGSGKTTICGLLKGVIVLGDEMNIIMRITEEYEVFPTPFSMSQRERERSFGEEAPLSRLFILRKSDRLYLEKTSYKTMLMSVLSNTVLFCQDQQTADNVLNVATELCHRVPCSILHFPRRPISWNDLENLMISD
jgi:hypothetical protein